MTSASQPKRYPRATYEPLNTLKVVARDVWIVDGPAIRFGFIWPKFPFPTRATIVRLADNALFVHSPVALSPALMREIEEIGRPEWIVGPSRLHYWWIPDWRAAYPNANIYLAPRIRERAGDRIDFPAHELIHSMGYPWDDAIDTLPIRGRFLTEIEFLHRPSGTLILTDLIENFESDKLQPGIMSWLTWLGAVRDPNGQMPRDMRLTFPREELRQAVKTMLAWQPQRIILAHGRWYDRDAVSELCRAFSWLDNSH